MATQLLKEWTDGDLQCCIAKESETGFVYGEVRTIAFPDENLYCVGSIDLTEYSEEQLNNIVSSWYSGGLTEIRKTYKDKANQIIAECIFEDMPLVDMFFCSEVFTSEDDAAEALQGYIEQYC